MRVLDVMTTSVVTVHPTDGLKEAARRMINAGVSGLPVVDQNDVLIGIITEADFVQAEADRGRGRYRRLLDALFGEQEARPVGETVEDAMTKYPVVIDVNATVSEAAREMSERGVKRLPVVDADGHLKGIVSRADIVAAFVRPDEVIEDAVRQDVIRRILMIDDHDIAVDVVEGVVTLAGTLPTRSDARLLVELTSRLEGVIRVEHDGLTWRMDDTSSTEVPRI